MLINAVIRQGGGPNQNIGTNNPVVLAPVTNGALLNFHAGEATSVAGVSSSNTAARPNGYEPPGSWVFAIKGGGLSAYSGVGGEGAIVADLSAAIDMAAALTGAGSLSGAMSVIAELRAWLTSHVDATMEEVAAAIWQQSLETGYPAEFLLRILASTSAGLVSGGPGAPVFRDLDDTEAVVLGIADVLGNRTIAAYNKQSDPVALTFINHFLEFGDDAAWGGTYVGAAPGVGERLFIVICGATVWDGVGTITFTSIALDAIPMAIASVGDSDDGVTGCLSYIAYLEIPGSVDESVDITTETTNVSIHQISAYRVIVTGDGALTVDQVAATTTYASGSYFQIASQVDGVVVAALATSGPNGTNNSVDWTGLTEDYDLVLNGFVGSSASMSASTFQLVDVGITIDTQDGQLVLLGASFYAPSTPIVVVDNAIASLEANLVGHGGVVATDVAALTWGSMIEAGYSASRIVRIVTAVAAGKISGGPGTPAIRNVGDTQDQVVGVVDEDGNRSVATHGP